MLHANLFDLFHSWVVAEHVCNAHYHIVSLLCLHDSLHICPELLWRLHRDRLLHKEVNSSLNELQLQVQANVQAAVCKWRNPYA